MAMHAGVIARNIQRERTHSLNKSGGPSGVPRSASGKPGGKPPTSRGCVKRTKHKGKKGKKGCRETYDLIVNIDLAEWQLTDEQVAEFKEVFMLFDKDEDGVLTFPELNVVMKSLGQRPSEKELLTMVRDVSADHIYDTIEFNEFLQMMSKQQRYGVTQDSLKDAFRIFDKDADGFISVEELRHIMKTLGEKMKDSEINEMIAEADSDNDGLINYEEFVQVLCNEKSEGVKKKKKHRKKVDISVDVDNVKSSTKTTTIAVVEGDHGKLGAASASAATGYLPKSAPSTPSTHLVISHSTSTGLIGPGKTLVADVTQKPTLSPSPSQKCIAQSKMDRSISHVEASTFLTPLTSPSVTRNLPGASQKLPHVIPSNSVASQKSVSVTQGHSSSTMKSSTVPKSGLTSSQITTGIVTQSHAAQVPVTPQKSVMSNQSISGSKTVMINQGVSLQKGIISTQPAVLQKPPPPPVHSQKPGIPASTSKVTPVSAKCVTTLQPAPNGIPVTLTTKSKDDNIIIVDKKKNGSNVIKDSTRKK